MKRADLEHILRASREVTGESEFVVLGSQSRLGKLIASVEDAGLRDGLGEALALCRSRARGGAP